MSVKRTAIAAVLACVAGLGAAHTATDGFEAFTLESARRLNALRAPARVPDLALQLADGGHARIGEIPARVLLVDFIYTRCASACAALGSIYSRLQGRLAAEIAAGEVRLVSISFDPEHDRPGELRAYRSRHSSGPAGWELGRAVDANELRDALEAFGVVVIPDRLGGYVHNAAVHVVGPERTLLAIFDPEDIDGIVRRAREVTGRTAAHVATR
jgi:protein SCO1/2